MEAMSIFEAKEQHEAAVSAYVAEPTEDNAAKAQAALDAMGVSYDASHASFRCVMPDRVSAEEMADLLREQMYIVGERIAKRRNGRPGYCLSVHGYWYW